MYVIIFSSAGSCLIYVCICSTKRIAWHRLDVSTYSLRGRNTFIGRSEFKTGNLSVVYLLVPKCTRTKPGLK